MNQHNNQQQSTNGSYTNSSAQRCHRRFGFTIPHKVLFGQRQFLLHEQCRIAHQLPN
jgi:hypothetical protein